MSLEPAPEDSEEFESQEIDRARIEPFYHSSDRQKPSPVWAQSQALRKLIDARGNPNGADRDELKNSILRQLPSLGLYREISYLRTEPMIAETKFEFWKKKISLYVLLFPGEARDNTGIKDLNDKVLNYDLNSEWMALRQKAVTEIFWQKEGVPAPKWVTVGQDYKTAYILPMDKSSTDFAADLIKFDDLLKKYLLRILEKAEQQITDETKKKNIAALKKALNKKEHYQFDYVFGVGAIRPSKSDRTIDLVFRLITEALKGAAIAKFATKGRSLKRDAAKKFAGGRAIKSPGKGEDSRGLAYDNTTYIRVSWAARDIKAFVATGKGREYGCIYVNKVWINALLYYRERYFGHPDMIRDVRKKALEKPSWQSTKARVATQRELFELYLVTLNMVDFVAGFLSTEYSSDVLLAYHELALEAFNQLQDATATIDWPRLIKVLTRDIRLTTDRRIVLGTTSEFQFYAYSSDYTDQVFFVFDVRDLGVDLMAHYEIAGVIVTDDNLKDDALVRLTLKSGDPTVDRKRVTYDTVVAIILDKFKSLLRGGGNAESEKAFGSAIPARGKIPDFEKCVQVMLGGDEIFVAAHPYFAKYEADIISDLDKATYADMPLNLRTAVAYSSAMRMPNPGGEKGVTNPQRSENFVAHHNALELATASHGFLKSLERTNRRIELYVEMLQTIEKKKKLAPPLAKRLADLRLTGLYTRSRYPHKKMTDLLYEKLLNLIGRLDAQGAEATKHFELVDFSGKKVPIGPLQTALEKLELDARNAVGLNNVRLDIPLPTALPKRIKKELDNYVDGKWPWGDKDR